MFFVRSIKHSRILPTILIFLFFLAIFNLQKRHLDREQSSLITGAIALEEATNSDYFQQERTQKQSLEMQKYFPTLGFSNLMADRHYLSFVQYFGDKPARDNTGHSLVSDYFETIVNYDPLFTDAYIILANANSVYAGNPEQTVALINEVLQATPAGKETSKDEFVQSIAAKTNVLWISKGMDELLFLGDTQAAEKSYKMAAKWAAKTESDRTQGIIDHNLKMARFLATNPDTREAQIRAWSMVLPNIKDEAHRQKIVDKIETLQAELANSSAKP